MANEFLAKRDQRDWNFFDAGMQMGVQLLSDYISQTLTDPAVMGKNRVFSRKSLDKVFDNCSKLDKHFCMAFTDHVEADYIREEWDRIMRQIYKEDAAPFEKRYPYAKKIKYMKPRKGWI